MKIIIVVFFFILSITNSKASIKENIIKNLKELNTLSHSILSKISMVKFKMAIV